MKVDYDKSSFVEALKTVGISRRQAVFVHSNLGYLGIPEGGMHQKGVVSLALDSIFEVIGAEGTLCLPAFTYSFCKKEIFDPKRTLSSGMGLFTDYVQGTGFEGFTRTQDPIFSVLLRGGKAEELSKTDSHYCFGEDSFWGKFHREQGVLLNINIMHASSTFHHYVERQLKVPYRYDKPFEGILRVNGEDRPQTWYSYVRSLEKPEDDAQFEVWEKLAMDRGIIKSCPLGRGELQAMESDKVFELVQTELLNRPDFLTQKCADYSMRIQPSSNS